MTETHLVGEWITVAELGPLLETARDIYTQLENDRMASQQEMSAIMAKMAQMGAAKIHEEVKKDAPSYGNPTVPGGIENGIAQLVDITLGMYKEGDNKGMPFFRAAGIVKHPVEVDGVPILGLRTQIGPEPLCNTPKSPGKKKTFKDHYAWVLNQIRILGGPVEGIKFEDLPRIFEALKKAKPYFRFRTWKGKKATTGPFKDREPNVNHEWNGQIDWSEDMESPPDDAVQDDSGVPPDAYDTEDQSGEPDNVQEPSQEAQEGAPAAADDSGVDEVPDLASLALSADEEDNQEAKDKLTAIALKLGIDMETIEGVDNWTMLAEMIDLASGGSEAEEAAPAPEPEPVKIPKKSEVYKFAPPGKNGKPSKPIDCIVVSVNEEKAVVNLKNMDDGKTIYRSVPFADLKVK